MSPRSRWIVLALALVGLGFASASSWVHYRLMTDPGYISPCDVNATFNCTQAYLSRFGSIGGVPVALGGVLWFALVALLAAFAGPADRSPVGAYIFALSTVALAAVLYLGYASFFVLKTACLLCLGTYAAVLGIFITTGLTSTMSITRLPVRVGSDLRSVVGRPLLLIIAFLFLGGAATAVIAFPREQQAAAPAALPPDFEQRFADAWSKQPRVDMGIAPEGAKVVIVKFNDWLCPSCKAYHVAYQPVIDKYAKSHPGAIKVVVKDYPWSAPCNQASIPGHESSCEAAAAVRIARDRNKADAMIDWIFANQRELIDLNLAGGKGSVAKIKAKVTEMFGATDFDREYQTRLPAIKRDVADAMALRVKATPTFFVNGIKTTHDEGGNLDPSVLDLAIKLALAKSGGK